MLLRGTRATDDVDKRWDSKWRTLTGANMASAGTGVFENYRPEVMQPVVKSPYYVRKKQQILMKHTMGI